MKFENYLYQTPECAKDLMGDSSTYPQFAKAAARLINHYARKYKPKHTPDHVNELFIRILLNWEHKLKRPIPLDVRDYWIKFHLGIIQRNPEYEKKLSGYRKRGNFH